jgi:8-oxo-dGTP pyrophosphatase MutT (NUDIX family)
LVVREETVLLISIASGRRWQLPKGHIEAGETAEQAAVREVREETGISGRVVAPLPGVEYWFVERGRKQVHKQVHYFLLAFLSGDTANYDPTEVSGASWFSWDEALTRLTFDNERRVVAAARELLSARPGLLAEGEPAA